MGLGRLGLLWLESSGSCVAFHATHAFLLFTNRTRSLGCPGPFSRSSSAFWMPKYVPGTRKLSPFSQMRCTLCWYFVAAEHERLPDAFWPPKRCDLEDRSSACHGIVSNRKQLSTASESVALFVLLMMRGGNGGAEFDMRDGGYLTVNITPGEFASAGDVRITYCLGNCSRCCRWRCERWRQRRGRKLHRHSFAGDYWLRIGSFRRVSRPCRRWRVQRWNCCSFLQVPKKSFCRTLRNKKFSKK